MEKFHNKYRIPSTRARFWDYSSDGLYFITICAYNRQMIFGEIENQTMILSAIGEITLQEWNRSFEIRRELFCDAFIIMPNHLHAIVRIVNDVETHGRASLRKYTGIAYRPPKSISSFVAGFKSAATTKINIYRNMPHEPVWQPRFHDRIIRNHEEYLLKKNYIHKNPSKWHTRNYLNS